MATRTYRLPTVNAAGKMSFPDSVNGLATGVDYAMRGVQKSFGDPDDYKLPVATSSTLGGVRIGDGFKVFADGEIQPEKSEFVLKPATASVLGGVAIGKNIDVDEAGKIIAGKGAFQSTDITESELAFEAVTGDKFRDGTILQEDLDAGLINKLLGVKQIWQNAQRFTLMTSTPGNILGRISVLKLSEKLILVGGCSHPSYANYWNADGFWGVADVNNIKTVTGTLIYENSSQIPDFEFGHSKITLGAVYYKKAANGKDFEEFGYSSLEWNRADNSFVKHSTKNSNNQIEFFRIQPTFAIID